MKPRTNPSYLSLSRHGIYYFRCRIPLETKKQYNISKNEVRKSLHTSNHGEALRKARRLWVEMAYNNIEEMYADIEHHDEMLKRGRELYNELQQIRKRPDFIQSDEQDYTSTLRTQYDWDCLRLAISKFDSKVSHPVAPSPATNINFREFQSDLQEIKNVLADDGLKKIPISEAVETYYQWYIQNQKENKKKDVPPKTRDDKKRTLHTFAIILNGSRLLKDLNQEIIENEYVTIAKKIPQRLGNMLISV
jgi:hypothetical protein